MNTIRRSTSPPLSPEALSVLADIATLQAALKELIETITRAEANTLLDNLRAAHAAGRRPA